VSAGLMTLTPFIDRDSFIVREEPVQNKIKSVLVINTY